MRERRVPGDIHLGVPVEPLAQLVELADLGVGVLVVPVVGAGQRGVEDLADDLHILPGQMGQDFVVLEFADGLGRALDQLDVQHRRVSRVRRSKVTPASSFRDARFGPAELIWIKFGSQVRKA